MGRHWQPLELGVILSAQLTQPTGLDDVKGRCGPFASIYPALELQKRGHMNQIPKIDKHKSSTDSLTHRNLEVLQLIADGYSAKEISAKIYLSYQTTKRHLSRIRKALGAKSTTHAVAIAIREGIIE